MFLHSVYDLPPLPDAAQLQRRWELVREVRAEAQKELEAVRVKGDIGSSLAAEVEIHADAERYRALAELGDDLRFVLITSATRIRGGQRSGTAEGRRAGERAFEVSALLALSGRYRIASCPPGVVRTLRVQPVWAGRGASACLSTR